MCGLTQKAVTEFTVTFNFYNSKSWHICIHAGYQIRVVMLMAMQLIRGYMHVLFEIDSY